MKLRSIATAAALVCVAAPSFALTPAQIDSNTVQLWLSGATAPTAAVYGAIKKLCADADSNGQPDDLHTYLNSNVSGSDAAPGKSAAGKFAAYACTMGPLAGSLDGVKTVVYHTFDIGSFEAYTPHLHLAGEVNPSVASSVKRLNDIKTTASCTLLTGGSNPANTYVNCGNSAVTLAANADEFSLPTLPIGGISDTEYTLNQLNLGVSRSLTDIGFEVSTNAGQVFGIAMSYPLYVAMQKAQGLISTEAPNGEACDATGTYPAGLTAVNSTAACQPNITRAQYTSLVSSAVADKDAKVLGLAAAPLTVERRVGTSGTQSSSNAFFLNKPCATGTALGELGLAGSNLVGSTTFPGGVTVRSNNGSGDVKTQITNASSAGTYALGVLSMENAPSASEKFAFAKLNGVSPNTDANQRQTAIDGAYEFWYEMVAFTANSAPQAGVDLMSGMVTAFADPAITNLRGVFLTPLSGFTNADFPTQVSKGYKAGNACSPIQF